MTIFIPSRGIDERRNIECHDAARRFIVKAAAKRIDELIQNGGAIYALRYHVRSRRHSTDRASRHSSPGIP